MSERKLTAPIAIIIAGGIIAAAILFTNSRQPAAAPATAGTQTAPTGSVSKPSSSDHIIGSPTAPIVMVEYSDFQCPFCQMIHPTLQKIVDESNGQIAWVMRNFPLYQIHPNAEPAANAAECIAAQAGNSGWWKFADTVFSGQNQQALGASLYLSIAQGLNINIATYQSCVSAKTYQSKIDAETSEAENAGGQGTPFVVILNTKTGKAATVPGALPYAQVMAVIKSVQ